ncbi:MAG TPA: acyl-CoA synthetase, partial [Acidimicrobiia bacterium]|nr:acyl-CoA synthetase [Acidimicrobiia bacterium]
PDFVALVDADGTEYSAGALLERANQAVHGLRALGLGPGDTVAAVLPNGVHPMTVYLAALQAGWYYVPINYRLSPPEIAYILSDSGAKAFVTHERSAATAIAAADEAGIPSDARLAVGAVDGFGSFADFLAAQPTSMPDDRTAGAAMHYTSGTTGRPKGVKRALSGIDPDVSAELFAMFLGLFGIQPRDDNVHLQTSPNYHTAVTVFAGNALHAGHRVVVMDKWDPEETLRLIERHRCTHTHMVPTQFHRMLQLPDDVRAKYDVSSMRWAIHAAAPCPIDVKRKMLDWWGPVIWEYYGATEGGGTLATPEDWVKYPGTVGNAWPISELKITDDDGNVCPPGTPGTVWMRMGSGDFEYKGDKEKTSKSHDAEGYFTVGDVGYLNEDGFLFLCDRKSDMIIAGGVNIYPAEIEGELLAHPQVADAAVFGIPDDDMGEQIKAVIEPREGVAPDDALRQSITEHLAGRLAKFKWPRTIDFIEEMPREPTGKLLKRTLRDPYWEGRDRAI